jgi:hypothetical protein
MPKRKRLLERHTVVNQFLQNTVWLALAGVQKQTKR